jgi:uncharacterized membrane protein YhaH (DUF805 family)
MFKNPFSFEGRIRRLEYGLTFIIYLVFYFLMLVITWAGEGTGAGVVIFLILIIPMIWFRLAQGAKRCHDIDKSGWWQIVPLFPFILLFKDGEAGENRFGENPKGIAGPNDNQYLDAQTLDGHMRS